MISENRILEVLAAKATDDGEALEIVVRTTQGPVLMQVAKDQLVELGGLCLEAATNAPLDETAAIPVTEIAHQGRPDGAQVIGFRIAIGRQFWLFVEGKGLESLLEFLLIATGRSRPPSAAGNLN